jgi:hypothetical protein
VAVTRRSYSGAFAHDFESAGRYYHDYRYWFCKPLWAARRTLKTPAPWIQSKPLILEQGFAVFDPFFSELRYPQELNKMGGVDKQDKLLLDELVGLLQSFLAKVK